jgi:hypothetical protein
MGYLPNFGSKRMGFGMMLALGALLLLLLALAGCGDAETSTGGSGGCPDGLEPATEYRLFFGLTDSDGEVIAEEEWQDFLRNVITPRFPGGLTILDAYGQWQSPAGDLHRESTKVLLVGVSDNDEGDPWDLLSDITAEWGRRHSGVVYHIVQEACAGIPS